MTLLKCQLVFFVVSQLLPFGDGQLNNEDMIDYFPERMDRFLDCISQVYFQQDSFEALFHGKTDSKGGNGGGKDLLRQYESEMMQKKGASMGAVMPPSGGAESVAGAHQTQSPSPPSSAAPPRDHQLTGVD